MIRIALAQVNPTVGDLKGNLQKMLYYIQQAKTRNADIVVFPEMVVCGYPPEDLLYKDHFVNDSLESLKALAKTVKGITAIIGFVDMDKNKELYNAAAVVCDGKVKGICRKENLPNYGVFDEKRYFKSGSKNKLFEIGKTKYGVNICEDIWIDGSVYAKQSKAGAKFLINISSSPYDVEKIKEREELLKKRAKETKKYICYANLVGGQDELIFDGTSLIVDPKGKIVAQGKSFEEDLVVCDLLIGSKTLPKGRKKIKKEAPAKTTQIQRIYNALVLGTHDYVIKNGFKKVVIGLSGGIDSALVACIAVDAIGKNNVIGITMPSRYTSKGTNYDAKTLARNLGIRLIQTSIDQTFNAYLKMIYPQFRGTKMGIAEENIQARIRGNLLMAFSNKFKWLVLTTGNKSEVAVGYCTLYGDMSGGFAVIKDVPKTTVYDLAKYVNARKTKVIPESIIKRPPTAELRPNQKDQDTLPPYAKLDAILEAYVERHDSYANISKKAEKELVKKVIKLIDTNEYKRRQSPPGIRITKRAFGKDWRLPITNRYREF